MNGTSSDQSGALREKYLVRTGLYRPWTPHDVAEDGNELPQSASTDIVTSHSPYKGGSNATKSAWSCIYSVVQSMYRIACVRQCWSMCHTAGAGELVATVKIVPYALERCFASRILSAIDGPMLSTATFRATRVLAVSTFIRGGRALGARRALTTLQAKPVGTEASLIDHIFVAHRTEDLAELLSRPACWDLAVVFGGSATSDRRDVVPAALEAAGGSVCQLGMPVDPGSLLLLGRLRGCPVVGAPGCARSRSQMASVWYSIDYSRAMKSHLPTSWLWEWGLAKTRAR